MSRTLSVLIFFAVLFLHVEAKRKAIIRGPTTLPAGMWHLATAIEAEQRSSLEPMLRLALSKMTSRRKPYLKCATVVADELSQRWVRTLAKCGESEAVDTTDSCTPMYILTLNDSTFNDKLNITTSEAAVLAEGERMQCGGYLLLLRDARSSVQLVRESEERRLVNPRARFLIWNARKIWHLEDDSIWYRVPGVVFVITNDRRNSTVELRGIRWPPERFGVPTELLDSFHLRSLLQNKDGKKRRATEWFLDGTSDLRGRTFRVVVFDQPPAVLRLRSGWDQVSYAGVEIEILSAMAVRMNFLIDYYEPEDGEKWGGVFWNGSSNGAVGELAEGRADLAIGSFFILPSYLHLLDMSVPYDMTCVTFLTPKPGSKPRWLAMVLPLDWPTWLGAFLALLLPALMVPALSHVAEFLLRSREDSLFRQVAIGCVNAVGMATQVALPRWPRLWPVRLLVCWLWFFWLLLALAYRGGLVSFMALPLSEPALDSLRELSASGLPVGGWGRELRELLTDGAGPEVSQVALRYRQVRDLEAALRQVASGRFALFENSRFLRFAAATRHLHPSGEASMRPMGECVVPVQMGIALQRNSPLTPQVDSVVRRLVEAGLVRKWYRDVVQIAKKEHENSAADGEGSSLVSAGEGSKRRAMALRDLQGAIYLLLFGWMASASAFLVEFVNGKKKEAKRRVEEVMAARKVFQVLNIKQSNLDMLRPKPKVGFPALAYCVLALMAWKKKARKNRK